MDRINHFYKIAFIASLFFVPIRFELGPLPIYAAAGLIGLVVLNTVVDLRRIAFRLSPFDYAVLAYFFLCLFYVGMVPGSGRVDAPLVVLGKTAFYTACYFAMRALNVSMQELTRGLLIGLALFTVLFAYAFFSSGLRLADLATFNFQRITVRAGATFSQLGTVAAPDDFTGRDLLRSTISEVFALSFLVFLQARRFGLLAQAFLFALLFQSRRSILAIGSFLLLSDVRWLFKFVAMVLVGLILFVVANTGIVDRFTSLASSQRVDMYTVAVEGLSNRALVGFGYGAKVGDYYVHNFVIASLYMMGIAGLILSLAVVGTMVWEALRQRSQLVVIPILGLAVGSTIEGMMTLTAWTCLAVMYNIRGAYQTAQRTMPVVPRLRQHQGQHQGLPAS
jgi:hypothetical protein